MYAYFASISGFLKKQRLLCLCCSLILLAGCGSDDVEEEPMPLESFVEELDVEEVWGRSIGSGSDDEYLSLTPVIVGDTIYAIDHHGLLKAIDKFSGDELAEFEYEEPVSAGLGGDLANLYFGTYHGEIIAVDRADGSEKWRVKLTSEILSQPVSNESVVVVQSVDGKVVGLNTSDGELKWRYDSNSPVLSIRGTATPIIGDDFAVTGFANGELVAFETNLGTPIWSVSVGTPSGRTELERLVDIDGQPVIKDQAVYSISYQGKLSAIHLPTGREIWSMDQSSYRAVELGFGNIYVTTAEDQVVAYNLTSRSEVWRQSGLKFRRLTGPRAFGNSVAVADFEGYIHFLSQVDGRIIARLQLDSDGVRVPMLIDNDMLFIFSNSGELAAYKIAS